MNIKEYQEILRNTKEYQGNQGWEGFGHASSNKLILRAFSSALAKEGKAGKNLVMIPTIN